MKVDKTNHPEEVVDLLDENDSVIGTISRKDLQESPGVIVRSIRVLIFDKNKRILFQKRSRKKTVMPGVWTLGVAGHIPSGRTPDETAPVEMFEELGLALPIEFWFKSLDEFPDQRRVWAYTFIGEYLDQKIRMDKNEVEKIAFLNQEEVDKMISSGEEFLNHTLRNAKKFWEEK